MFAASPPTGPTRHFAGWSSASSDLYKWDQYGFLVPSDGTFTFEGLFDAQATLVVAPPWLGKTTVARAIDAYLRETDGKLNHLNFGKWVHLSLLDQHLPGSQVKPPWWPEWSASKNRDACWLVDALDEARDRAPGLLNWLLELLRRLDSRTRQSLRLILFARSAELPKEVFAALKEIYGQQHHVVELLALDRRNAEAIITKHHRERTLNTIENRKLQHLAGYPAALEYLKTQKEDADASEQDIWRGLMRSFLAEPNGLRPPARRHEPEEWFRATGHLAAALTFSGIEEIVWESQSSTAPTVTLQDLIPLGTSLSRGAAREALNSGMFSRTPSGFRFVRRNVREWMCAFGVSDLSLERLKLLLRSDENQGLPVPRSFRDLAVFLRKTTTRPEVREWLAEVADILPSDAAPPSLDQAIAILDRLERLAIDGEWDGGSGAREKFARLRLPGVGADVARRLSEKASPPSVRQLLLKIASAIGAREPADLAAEIIRDTTDDPEVRSWSAAYLRSIGNEEILRSLIPFIEAAKPTTRIDKDTVSILISALLRTGIWGAHKASKHVPEVDPDDFIIGATQVLPREIARCLTSEKLADAIAISRSISPEKIEQLNRYRGGFPPKSPRREILAAAARTIAEQRPVEPEVLKTLIPFSLTCSDHDLFPVLKRAFHGSPEARRLLFKAYVERDREGSHANPYWMRNALTVEDLPWLEEQLPAMASRASFVWSAFLALARSGEIPEEVGARCQALVRKHAPEFLEALNRAHEQQEESEREQEARKLRERSLQEVDEEILSTPDLTFQQRLWSLARLNFLDPEYRRTNLIGVWSDLPGELREKILDVCQEALDETKPTPIPPGRSFPGAILHEASAFVKLLRERPSSFELTSARITKWLPAGLVGIFDGVKHELLLSCVRVDREVTEEIVLAAIKRELAQDRHYSALLRDLPQELWTKRISDWVAEVVESEETLTETRVTLLDLLAIRAAERAVPLAHDFVADQSIERLLGVHKGFMLVPPEADIGSKALDILLALAPDAAWPLIKEGFEILGKELLTRLSALHGRSLSHFAVDLSVWPTERIAELEEMLLRAYPPEDDPDLSGRAFSLTPDHELRRLRYRLFELLFDREESSDRERLNELSAAFPSFEEWYRWRMADRKARELFEDYPEDLPPDPRHPSAERVVRALIDADYRLIRDGRDLLDVVVEDLQRINEDASEDLAMLYRPEEIGGGSRRRHEEALQLYVRRRLKERLPGKTLDRECEVRHRRKLDIKVQAPALNSSEDAVVIIEVKWSDNNGRERGISTGLRDQLGKNYLLAERRKYGVFLVGWNGTLGTWHDTTIDPPNKEDLPRSLLTTLEAQAEEFQVQHPEIVIRPLVFDLTWPSEK